MYLYLYIGAALVAEHISARLWMRDLFSWCTYVHMCQSRSGMLIMPRKSWFATQVLLATRMARNFNLGDWGAFLACRTWAAMHVEFRSERSQHLYRM